MCLACCTSGLARAPSPASALGLDGNLRVSCAPARRNCTDPCFSCRLALQQPSCGQMPDLPHSVQPRASRQRAGPPPRVALPLRGLRDQVPITSSPPPARSTSAPERQKGMPVRWLHHHLHADSLSKLAREALHVQPGRARSIEPVPLQVRPPVTPLRPGTLHHPARKVIAHCKFQKRAKDLLR